MFNGEVVVIADGSFHARVVSRIVSHHQYRRRKDKARQWRRRWREGIGHPKIGIGERAFGRRNRDLGAEGRDVHKSIIFDADLPRVEEDAEAGTNARLAVSLGIKGKAYTRRKVEIGSSDSVLRQAGVAGEEKARGCIGKLRGLDSRRVVCGAELLDPALDLVPRNKRLPPHAEIESKVARDVEVILCVEVVVVVAIVLELACALLEGPHASQKEARKRIARVVCGEGEDSAIQESVAQQ